MNTKGKAKIKGLIRLITFRTKATWWWLFVRPLEQMDDALTQISKAREEYRKDNDKS